MAKKTKKVGSCDGTCESFSQNTDVLNGMSAQLSIDIIRSFTSIYSCVYYIDIKKSTFTTIKVCSYIQSLLSDDSVETLFYHIQNDFALPEYTDDVKKFTNLNDIDAVLGDRKQVSIEFVAESVGWVRASIMEASRDADGKLEHILYAMQVINEEKNHELAMKKAAYANQEVIEGLGSEYYSVFLVDYVQDSVEVFRASGPAGKMMRDHVITHGKRWTEGLETYAAENVVEKDRELLIRNLSRDSMLSNPVDHRFVYQRGKDVNAVYLSAKVVFVTRHDGYRVAIVATRDADEEVRREKESMRIMEDFMGIISAIAYEYQDLYLLTTSMDSYRCFRHNTALFSLEARALFENNAIYSVAIKKYAATFVVEEDRENFIKQTDSSLLRTAVPDFGLYFVNYRRIEGNGFKFYQVGFARTRTKSSSGADFVMGFRNVNDAVKKELLARESIKTSFNLIHDVLKSGMWKFLFDSDGNLIQVEWSNEIRKLLGYANEEEFPNTLETFINSIHKDDLDIVRKEYNAVISGNGTERYLSFRMRLKNGTYRWFDCIGKITTNNESSAKLFAGILIDVTQRKENEQLLRDALKQAEVANRAKSDFLSSMSHDIRTPMNSIIGMTALARSKIDNREKVQECLEKIDTSSKYLLALVNEVLDMSKIEDGKEVLYEAEFNMSDLMDNVLNMLRPQAKAHAHRLDVRINNLVHEKVIGDTLKIQQIFSNLVSNSIKYTPDGGTIGLSLSEHKSPKPGMGWFRIVVRDNGIGMTPEFMERMFEPFVRADDSRINKINGTGLGLSITKNIVRMMGGDIHAESKVNEGTVFTVDIYLKLQEDEFIDYTMFVDLPVLVFDNDPITSSSICDILAGLCMKPVPAYTADEVLQKVCDMHAEGKDYYAVIIDWALPDGKCLEVMDAVAKKLGNDAPLLIVSTTELEDVEKAAKSAGAIAVLSKPMFKSRVAHLFNILKSNDTGSLKSDDPIMLFESMDWRKKKLLLVEDNELNAKIAKEILEMTGIYVDWVQNGVQAVDIVTEKADGYYDVILMDIQMPKMNGYEATRAIRALDKPYAKTVPVIAMTANAFVEDVQAAKGSGMNEHIAKPLDLRVFARIMEKYMSSE